MKGLISGIKRMEIHDGDGLRTTVFFKGCPLKCIWCHNPESISFETQVAFYKEKCVKCGACGGERNVRTAALCPMDAIYVYGREYELGELMETVLQDEAFFKNSGGGVTLSGGECLCQTDFVTEFARKLSERGISVNIDTCGHVRREVLTEIKPYVDTFLYDVKAIDPAVHAACTGKDNELILDNLRYLSDSGCKIEVRYPLVKGYNDGECEGIAKMLAELKGVSRVKVLKYHSFSASRYEALGMSDTMPKIETTEEDVDAAVKVFESFGVNAINGAKED